MARIIRLEAENFARLKVVHIDFDPEGNLQIISGANAAGKSSVLNAFMWCLGGPGAMKWLTEPIREGEEQASVTLDLEDFVVERVIVRGKNAALKVTSKDGAKFSSPQKFLDEKLGVLSFDPLAFTQMKPDAQRKTLLELVELPFDPDELDARRNRLYDDRTETGRQIKTLEGALAGWSRLSGELPEETSVSAAVEAYTNAQRAHAAYDAAWATRSRAEEAIVRLTAELQNANGIREAAMAEMNNWGQLPDLDDLKLAVDTVEDTNASIREQKMAVQKWVELDALTAQREHQSEGIKAFEKEKADALAAAKMPVEGLSFDEQGIIFNGLPYAQASSAEQLRVSLGMAIAKNPEIRVIRIVDGSLLDSKSMALVAEMAEEHDFQVLLEVVDETGELGVFIEDGAVKE